MTRTPSWVCQSVTRLWHVFDTSLTVDTCLYRWHNDPVHAVNNSIVSNKMRPTSQLYVLRIKTLFYLSFCLRVLSCNCWFSGAVNYHYVVESLLNRWVPPPPVRTLGNHTLWAIIFPGYHRRKHILFPTQIHQPNQPSMTNNHVTVTWYIYVLWSPNAPVHWSHTSDFAPKCEGASS